MTLAASSTAQNFWRYVQEQGYFGSINDQLSKLLTAEGYSGPTPSSLYSLLGSLGYTGTLNERINSFEREYTIRYGNTAAWSPLALFAAAEAGVWYDPSDLSTMFQDVAGTVPVTADGQLVARINDKSGRGNHATQATEARRPLYKTSGGLHWLQFDGVDDSLATAAIDFSGTYTMSTFYGVRVTSTGAYRALLGNGVGNAAGTAGKFAIYLPANVSTEGRNDFGGVAASNKTNITLQTGVRFIGAQLLDSLNSPYQKVRKNGVQTGTNTVDVGGQAFLNRELKISDTAWIGAAGPFEGNIYSLIVRGALSDAAQIAQAEQFVAGKTGVVL